MLPTCSKQATSPPRWGRIRRVTGLPVAFGGVVGAHADLRTLAAETAGPALTGEGAGNAVLRWAQGR